MKVLVLNASPKAKTSITLQNSLYLEKKFPSHSFSYIHIGCSEKANREKIDKTAGEIESSDLVLFSFPVYTFLAPSQLHYFIRILKENGLSFDGKCASIITTSKHFYDTTAHRWLEENLLDLGFSFIEGLSLDMEDLLKEEGREELTAWFERTIWAKENGVFETQKRIKSSSPALPDIPVPAVSSEKKDDYTVSIVVDYTYGRERLEKMVSAFASSFPYRTRIVDLSSFTFKGGCLGCLKCALEGKCVYRDGFENLLENEVLSSDAVLYAFTVTDHSMGPRFKTYDDRRFYNGHRTVSVFKPVGYIIDGDISREENLRTVLEARSDVGRNYLAGMAYDASTIEKLSLSLSYALEKGYHKPRTFYGVGGMKIFRDLIWVMRGIMRDDHKFYKKNGLYDFPQKERGKMIALSFAGSLMRNKKLMAKGGAMMDKGMLGPYQKVIDNA